MELNWRAKRTTKTQDEGKTQGDSWFPNSKPKHTEPIPGPRSNNAAISSSTLGIRKLPRLEPAEES
jgi:hypothetical protein